MVNLHVYFYPFLAHAPFHRRVDVEFVFLFFPDADATLSSSLQLRPSFS